MPEDQYKYVQSHLELYLDVNCTTIYNPNVTSCIGNGICRSYIVDYFLLYSLSTDPYDSLP